VTKSRMMEKRFSIHEGDGERIYIDDDDFHWDALLRVSGDFESCEEKKRYAQAICDVLNAAEDSIPYRPAAETSPAQCDHSWVTSNFEAPRCLWCHVEKSAAETGAARCICWDSHRTNCQNLNDGTCRAKQQGAPL
jgi:hypothetical protein